ncbi:MerR family transcriptional regulator [Actinoplanes sp. NPDC004185]
MPSHTPKQAAAISGFSLHTLRYYERVGLLPRIRRTATGRRVFSETDLKWLSLLRCLRDTGMPIAEMQQFVHLMNGGAATTAERAEVLSAHEQRVADQISRLQGHLVQIRSKIETYRDGRPWSPPVADDARPSISWR